MLANEENDQDNEANLDEVSSHRIGRLLATGTYELTAPEMSLVLQAMAYRPNVSDEVSNLTYRMWAEFIEGSTTLAQSTWCAMRDDTNTPITSLLNFGQFLERKSHHDS